MPVLTCQPGPLGGRHQPVQPGEQPGEVLGVGAGGGRPGVHPLEEEQLAGPEGADPGEAALVEECLDEGAGVGPDPFGCGIGVPVGAEHVGPEVAHEVGLARRGHQVEHAEAQPERGPLAGEDGGAQVARVAARARCGARGAPPATAPPSAGGCAAWSRCRTGGGGACPAPRPRWWSTRGGRRRVRRASAARRGSRRGPRAPGAAGRPCGGRCHPRARGASAASVAASRASSVARHSRAQASWARATCSP